MSTGSSGNGSDELGQDVELNIASIVDCFTVLITYLLAAASFLSVGSLSVTVVGSDSDQGPTPASTSVVEKLPTDLLVMELRSDHSIEFRSFGSQEKTTILNEAAGVYDFEGATKFMAEHKQNHQGLENVVLTAQNTVEYGDVVHATDAATKAKLPVAMAAGESI